MENILKNSCDDILSIILKHSHNYHCILVCKRWNKLILMQSQICNTCNKIVKMYDDTLWFTYAEDKVCHGYYEDNLKKYNMYKSLLQYDYDCKFLKIIERHSIGLCLWALKYNPDSTKYFKVRSDFLTNVLVGNTNRPNLYGLEIQTEDICLEIIKSTPHGIQYVKNQTEKLCLVAVTSSPMTLEYILEENKTKAVCLAAVKTNGVALYYVPKNMRTEKLCLTAVTNNGYALRYVPTNICTEEMCMIAARQAPDITRYMPEIYHTEKVYMQLLDITYKTRKTFKYMNREKQTNELCLKAVKLDGYNLKYVNNKTEEICLEAVKNVGRSLKYVPTIYYTENILFEAINNYALAIKYIPERYQIEEMHLKVVKTDGLLLCHVPDKYKTENVCTEALKNNIEAIKYVCNMSEDKIMSIFL